jgi:hypothetical protein
VVLIVHEAIYNDTANHSLLSEFHLRDFSLYTKSDNSSNVKIALIEQGIPKLSYFDPSDAHDKNIKGNMQM